MYFYSSIEKPISTEPPSVPGPSGDDGKLVSKLSDMTVEDTRSISDVSYQMRLPAPQQGTGGKP